MVRRDVGAFPDKTRLLDRRTPHLASTAAPEWSCHPPWVERNFAGTVVMRVRCAVGALDLTAQQKTLAGMVAAQRPTWARLVLLEMAARVFSVPETWLWER